MSDQLYASKAVSYTHLDVYKRQVMLAVPIINTDIKQVVNIFANFFLIIKPYLLRFLFFSIIEYLNYTSNINPIQTFLQLPVQKVTFYCRK